MSRDSNIQLELITLRIALNIIRENDLTEYFGIANIGFHPDGRFFSDPDLEDFFNATTSEPESRKPHFVLQKLKKTKPQLKNNPNVKLLAKLYDLQHSDAAPENEANQELMPLLLITKNSQLLCHFLKKNLDPNTPIKLEHTIASNTKKTYTIPALYHAILLEDTNCTSVLLQANAKCDFLIGDPILLEVLYSKMQIQSMMLVFSDRGAQDLVFNIFIQYFHGKIQRAAIKQERKRKELNSELTASLKDPSNMSSTFQNKINTINGEIKQIFNNQTKQACEHLNGLIKTHKLRVFIDKTKFELLCSSIAESNNPPTVITFKEQIETSHHDEENNKLNIKINEIAPDLYRFYETYNQQEKLAQLILHQIYEMVFPETPNEAKRQKFAHSLFTEIREVLEIYPVDSFPIQNTI